jgi:hypothetical protein
MPLPDGYTVFDNLAIKKLFAIQDPTTGELGPGTAGQILTSNGPNSQALWSSAAVFSSLSVLADSPSAPVFFEVNNNSLTTGDAYILIDVDGSGVPSLGFERPSANWTFGIHTTQNFQLCRASTLNSSVIMEFDNSSGAITLGIASSTATHSVNGALGVVRRAGIDGSSSANYSLRLGQATTLSGTTQGGLNIANAVTSSATTQAFGVASSITTAAASFTVPNFYHFYADNTALGLGSSVTRYISYFATTPTRGTNNASFADNTSFTGSRFISQTGTAQSDFGGIVNASTNGIRTKVSTANTANPPTDAELDSAFGTPATVGSGFVGIVNDNNGGTNEYLCWSDGTNWFYATGTKAV